MQCIKKFVSFLRSFNLITLHTNRKKQNYKRPVAVCSENLEVSGICSGSLIGLPKLQIPQCSTQKAVAEFQ